MEEQERLIDAAPADDSVEGQGGLGLGTEEEVTELEIEGSVLVVSYYFRFIFDKRIIYAEWSNPS